MFTQRQTHLENILLSAVLLILTAAGQSAMQADNPQTTATPAASNSTLTPRLNRSTVEPLVLRSHVSCGGEHASFCENGGLCMYPQDSHTPFCICTSPYVGHRCLFLSVTDETRSPAELEQLIAIGFGAAMLIFVLAIIVYCLVYKRCVKSTPLIKAAPSELSV